MSNIVADALVRILPDVSEFNKQAPAKIEKAATPAGKNFAKKFGSIAGVATKVVGGSVAAIFTAALAKGFGRLVSIENAEAKLKGLGYSTKDVAKLMGSAKKAVMGTAYGMGDAATAAAQLAAAGIKGGSSMTKAMEAVTDAASITGTDLNSMAGVFSDVSAGGKVTGDTLQQFQMRGVSALSMIAKHFNITDAEARKMVSKGKVGFKDFQQSIQENIGTAAEEAGGTFSGAMDNLGAALGRIGANILGPGFKDLPTLIGKATDFLKSLEPVAEKVGKVLGAAFKIVYDWVMQVLDKIGKLWTWLQDSGTLDKLKSAFDGLSSALKTAYDWFNKHIGVFKKIAAAIFIIYIPAMLTMAVTSTVSAVKVVASWIAQKVSALGSMLAQAATMAATGIVYVWYAGVAVKNGLKVIGSWIKQAAEAVWSAAKTVAQFAILAAQWVWYAAKAVANGIIAAGAWAKEVAAAAIAKTKLVAQFAVLAAKWVWYGIRAVAGAAVAVVAWVMQQGPAIAAVAAAAVAFGAMVVGWITTAATATASAIIMAAAWLIALGPVGLIIAAIVGIVAVFVILWVKCEAFRDFWKGLWDKIKQYAKVVWDWLKKATKVVVDAIVGYITFFLNIYKTIWNGIKSAAKAVWDWLKGATSAIWTFIKTRFENLKQNIVNVWNKIKDAAKAAWDGVKEKVSSVINGIIDFVKGIPGKVKSALSGAAQWLIQTGKDMIQGLINGVKNMAGALGSALVGLLPGPLKKFASKLGLASPSKLFKKYGKWVVEGFVAGLVAKPEAVSGALDSLAKKMSTHGEKNAAKIVTKAKKSMAAIGNALATNRATLAAQQNRLKELRDAYSSTFDSIKDALSKSEAFGGGEGLTTFDEIYASLTATTAKTQEFAATLAKLKTLGLNATAFEQISQAGVGALDAAKALAGAGAAGIAKINTAQTQLDAAAKSAGTTTAQALYQSSINAASAYVNTLAKAQPTLIKNMTKAGEALVAAVQKAIDKTKGGYSSKAAPAKKKPAKKRASGDLDYSGGLALVGETGPELLMLPRHSRIFPSEQTRRLSALQGAGDGGSTVYNVTMNVSVDDLSKMGTLSKFAAMLEQQRMNARRTARSGTVVA